MNFSLKINMNNAAFADGSHDELARQLHELARYLETTGAAARVGETGTTRDINGNRVGEWKITR